MAGATVCRVCRALLTSSDEQRSPGACPYCGAQSPSETDAGNPYAPPRASLAPGASPSGEISPVPRSAEGKLLLALKLFAGNLPLIAALFLTVWFPAYVLLVLIGLNQPDADPERIFGLAQLANLVEFVFGPLYIGGTLSILADRMSGQPSRYTDALQVGLHNWWRLIGARFVANLIITAGCIALIVPGIIFAVRYAILDSVVVLDGAGIGDSRARSSRLIRGKGREIFVVNLVYFCVLVWIGTALSAMILYLPAPKAIGAIVVGGFLGNVVKLFVTCYFFTYFWEAHARDPLDFNGEASPGNPRDFERER